MTKEEHRAFIASLDWQKIRARFFASKLWKGRCETCLREDVPVDLHHKSYKRFGGSERLTDLIALCRTCHTETHKLNRKNGSGGLWSAHKQIRLRKKKRSRVRSRG